MIARLLITTVLIATAPVAEAQEKSDAPPKRVRSVLLHGEEPCPKPSEPDEIVVCAIVGASPYRIPKRFRDKPVEGPTGQAWTRRMEVVEEVNRTAMPNSCSVVGSGGQTGCTRQFLQQWYQDRLEKEAREARVP